MTLNDDTIAQAWFDAEYAAGHTCAPGYVYAFLEKLGLAHKVATEKGFTYEFKNTTAPVGDWLWSQFMDYCKAQGVAPANANRLFEIVSRAREEFDEKSGERRYTMDQMRDYAEAFHRSRLEGYALVEKERVKYVVEGLQAEDAARYRWIREQHQNNGFAVAELGQGEWRSIEDVMGTPEGNLDAAVDAARARK